MVSFQFFYRFLWLKFNFNCQQLSIRLSRVHFFTYHFVHLSCSNVCSVVLWSSPIESSCLSVCLSVFSLVLFFMFVSLFVRMSLCLFVYLSECCWALQIRTSGVDLRPPMIFLHSKKFSFLHCKIKFVFLHLKWYDKPKKLLHLIFRKWIFM